MLDRKPRDCTVHGRILECRKGFHIYHHDIDPFQNSTESERSGVNVNKNGKGRGRAIMKVEWDMVRGLAQIK